MENNQQTATSEIGTTEKISAGMLLIIFTLFPIWLIMAYWPDRLPNPKENVRPLYIDELYHIRLACIPDSICCTDTLIIKNTTVDTVTHTITDSAIKKTDSTGKPKDTAKTRTDTVRRQNLVVIKQRYYTKDDLIDLNTILLILVAATGFLGNMIHIATSFTAFVGSNQFKRSWVLWYFVKPFTASAIALGLYFVFRGGFFNYSADASGINLYGVLTMSVLAGLFTDKATLKLADIFEVVFSVKDKRTDKLGEPKISSITPSKLSLNVDNIILINGENLDKGKFTFKINDEVVGTDKIGVTASVITIHYTIPSTQKDKTEFKLQILDDKNKEVISKTFTLQ